MTDFQKLLLVTLVVAAVAIVDQRFAGLCTLLALIAAFYEDYRQIAAKLLSTWANYKTANERFFGGVKFLILILPAIAFWSTAVYLLFNEVGNISVSFGNGQWFSAIPSPVIIAYGLLGAAYVWVLVSKRLTIDRL